MEHAFHESGKNTYSVEHADVRAAAESLEDLLAAAPHRIHAVLTDTGIQFADLPKAARDQRHAFVVYLSTEDAFYTASTIVIPSPTIPVA